jgi:hypothetical protein
VTGGCWVEDFDGVHHALKGRGGAEAAEEDLGVGGTGELGGSE